ncbi:sigma factor-like helix-turn-helix DNA-binding protein [Streptomyces sp. NBC_00083]|uniref:sigma factor-like helix-turn-helix DNA-binding protein n=1 Tax=Streptomyces sp. NBC_00083 TaxID=2975647 RepID=UPI0022530127|nr:sigma factor-like helix-turn-helix DNA-binding protein [Streptomyces sp. NBC_00083]MCX5385151.1 helix-turn-helix domain-containing protein [Streptomyces sp. NBC_00083]
MTQSTAGTDDTDPMSPLPTPKERRRLREAKALSEAQVAKALGVTRATVRSWETGRTTPRGRRLAGYAKLLTAYEAETSPQPTGAPEAAGTPAGALEATPPAPVAPVAPGSDGAGGDDPAGDGAGGGGPRADRHSTGARAQSVNPAKPPAKPHAVNTRPKPAADGAAPRSSRPGGRTAKPSVSPHPAPAPAGPASPSAAVTVPEPAKEALKSTALTGAGATAKGGVRTLPERPPESGGAPGPDAPDEAHGGATPKARTAPAAAGTPDSAVPEPAAHADPSGVDQPGLTPAEAFDALYAATAPALAQQTYLLTGRTRLARESVARAFHLAWENWPQVATDRDPVGWVRTAAYEYAMAPWHRFRRTHKHPDQPPVEPERRALLDALLALPPAYRRTVLLYDGLGLDLPETAAETQASTPAAANRVLNARAALAERVPAAGRAPSAQALSSVLRDRITDLAQAGPAALTALPKARTVRVGGERRRRFWTRAAIAFTTLIVGATAFTVVTVPHYHVRPVPVGERVGGVPVNSGPQRLTGEDIELRDKLRREPARGPHRLVLDIR